MVPTMFIRLMKLPEEVRNKYDMSSLRHIIHAAAPCPADVKRAMIEWWGPVIYEFYGSTESGAVTFANSEDALKKPGTVGKISPGAELRFIGDDGRESAAGRDRRNLFAHRGQSGFHLSQQAGEARRDRSRRFHHLRRCRLYRRRRLRLHLRPQARHGDFGRRQHLSGRDRGRAACVPGVHDCAVFGIPDEEFGEALMAVVEPQPGVTLDVAADPRPAQGSLADYKVPKHIEIQANLPREDSGKIFKRRLRDPYWERAGRRI